MEEHPVFAAGETQNVIAYADKAVLELGTRLGLGPTQGQDLHRLFMDALRTNAARMAECLEAPFVEAVPASRELFTALGHWMIKGVETDGLPHLAAAIDFMRRGGNVLLISNHTSGADTLVLDHVANARFEGAAHAWLYMAGHVVNYFLLPLAITGGVHRIQIFSAKYCAQASAETKQRMKQNNAQALMAIGPKVMGGGKCVVLYPEGGRGEGQLLEGEPRTMKVPQLMDMVSPHGLMVLPSYVHSTDILPVVRGPNEFNEFLAHARRGTAVLRFGCGLMWNELQPTKQEVEEYISTNRHRCSGDFNHALKQCQMSKCMRAIAALAPAGARGPYERGVA